MHTHVVYMYVHVCAHASLPCIESSQLDSQESGNIDHSVKRSQVAEVARRFTPTVLITFLPWTHVSHKLGKYDISSRALFLCDHRGPLCFFLGSLICAN